MKILKKAQRNSLTTLDISTQHITSHLWMLNHSKISKILLNSPITRNQWWEFQSQLNLDKKELIKHHKLKEASQLILLRKLICLIDIQWLSLDNSITVSSMLTLSSRRWKSQTLSNLLNFILLDLCQRMIQHGTVTLLHSNMTLMLKQNEKKNLSFSNIRLINHLKNK